MSEAEVIRTIEAGLPGVDAARSQGYSQLAQLRDAKARSYAREQRFLAQKHGGATHPRIAAAQERFVINEQFRRELAVVREVAETPLPEVDATSLLVHGFVRRRSDQIGIAGVTLALTDKDGSWVRELGYACTDARGYFLIKATVAKEPEPGSADEPLKPSRAAAPRTLSLRVFGREGHVIHTESRPVLIQAGTIDFRLILLDDKAADCGCTPPPPTTGGKPAPGRARPTHPPGRARPKPSAAAPPQRVGGLKDYQQPSPEELAGTPLEAIRGIGPKTAGRLREGGIANVEVYSKTPGAAMVKVAGFDIVPPKKKPAVSKKTKVKAKAKKPRKSK